MSASTFSRFKPDFLRKKEEPAAVDMTLPADDKNAATVSDGIAPTQEQASDDPEKDVVPAEDAQRGVQQVEAVTLTWTKPYLIAVFFK
tara:strand:+ start:727 stop:990 length:264 start_codon:yes stop_codon:yes gene_type:complete